MLDVELQITRDNYHQKGGPVMFDPCAFYNVITVLLNVVGEGNIGYRW